MFHTFWIQYIFMLLEVNRYCIYIFTGIRTIRNLLFLRLYTSSYALKSTYRTRFYHWICPFPVCSWWRRKCRLASHQICTVCWGEYTWNRKNGRTCYWSYPLFLSYHGQTASKKNLQPTAYPPNSPHALFAWSSSKLTCSYWISCAGITASRRAFAFRSY